MSGVVIGMDPHKRSATIEIINDREQVLGRGRFTTDTEGYRRMLGHGASVAGPGLGRGRLQRHRQTSLAGHSSLIAALGVHVRFSH